MLINLAQRNVEKEGDNALARLGFEPLFGFKRTSLSVV
jgi:hypothetical protein